MTILFEQKISDGNVDDAITVYVATPFLVDDPAVVGIKGSAEMTKAQFQPFLQALIVACKVAAEHDGEVPA